MLGLVSRFQRTSLLLASVATLGFAAPDVAWAGDADTAPTTFVAQPGYQFLKGKIRQGKPITIAFLGGSITAGATTRPRVDPLGRWDYGSYDRELHSWRARVFEALRSRFEIYPRQFTMVNAALSSTGSMVGAFRFDEDVANHKPDLLFVEFTVNDAPLAQLSSTPGADCSIQRSLLSIVEQARACNPNIAIMMAISSAKDILDDPTSPNAMSRAITKDAAIHFGVPYVDITEAFYEQPLPPGIGEDDLYSGAPLLFGNDLHPSPIGHEIYATSILSGLSRVMRHNGFDFPTPRIALSTTLQPFPLSPLEVEPVDFPHTDGFHPAINLEDWVRHPIFQEKDALFVHDTEVSMSYQFQGSAAAIWWEWDYDSQPIHGKFRLLLDGQDLGVFSSHPDPLAGEQRLPRFQVIGEGLDPAATHTLTLEIPKYQPLVLGNVLNLAMIRLFIDQG